MIGGAADGHRPEPHQLKPPLLEFADFLGVFETLEDGFHS
jgi:hypothetical protein